MNLIVIGAGIAGSSVVRALRAAGNDVEHIAASVLACESRASAAILWRGYHTRARGQSVLFDRTLALYAEWGVPITRGGWVSETGRDGPHRYDPDWALVHPAVPLVGPDRAAHAVATPRGVRLDDGTDLHADRVIWCTGVHRAPAPGSPRHTIAHAAPGQLRYGVTWAHTDPEALTQPDRIRVHRLRPYQTIVAGATHGNGARLGTSSASSAGQAFERADEMLAAAADIGIITTTDGWLPLLGRRAHTLSHPLAHTDGPHWVFRGLHHTGYALAPAMAEDVAARILQP